MQTEDPHGCVERTKTDQTGVRHYDRKRTEPGLIVFHTVVDNKVVVIDEEGRVIEEFSKCPPGYDLYRPAKAGNRASIYTIIVLNENRNRRLIAEINKGGEIIWATKHRQFTHDFHILRERHVLSVVRENRHIDGTRFSDTSMVELNVRGDVLWSWSLWDHIDELSTGSDIRRRIFNENFDNPFHINSIQYQDSEFTRKQFGEPVVLVSARNADVIFIVGRNTDKILYELPPLSLGQHHARILPDRYPGRGNIIIFDNGISYCRPDLSRGKSRVIEFSLRTKNIVWCYEAEGFFSPIVGAQQRFVGGNTLITEGYYGHIFEVNYEGETVWDYVYPESNDVGRSGKELYEAGLRQIYRAYKVPHDWLE
jgi:hypothetical protein